MIKILFICHGNICRSPMAEFLFKEMLCKNHLDREFKVASAATSTEELGNPIYPPVVRLLSARGIDCRAKRARQVTARDYDEYDYLVCMDQNNLRNIRRIIPTDSQHKISLLLDWAGEGRDVADPWYTRDFHTTERDIETGCAALLSALLKS